MTQPTAHTVTQPVTLPDDTAPLREAVRLTWPDDPRRWRPARVHVGRPGGPTLVAPAEDDPPLDHGVRADLLGTLLDAVRHDVAEPWVWVVRCGPLEAQDVDLAWVAAARAATGERGLDWRVATVTRAGWLDHRSGAVRLVRRRPSRARPR